jgi:hypothetical protein
MVVVYAIAPKPWSPMALFLAGAFFGMLAFAWDSPPEFIETWRRGAEGERRTAKALRALRKRGWTITHDLPARFGNHDHVLVGRQGVFLLDTKNVTGEARVENGLLTVHRREDDRATYQLSKLPRSIGGAAAELHDELRRLVAVQGLWVSAVVVVWPALEDGVVDGDRITYVSGDRVADWLENQRPRLSAEHAAVVGAAVRTLGNRAVPRPVADSGRTLS